MKRLFILFASVAAISGAHAQTPALDLKAANYNPVTGVWTDSSPNGNDATVGNAGSRASLDPGATPNGSSAVGFTSGDFFNLTSSINSAAYTVFAYIEATGGGNPQTIVSGGANGGAFQYRISGDGFTSQEDLRQGQANLGQSNTSIPTTSFVNINTAIDGSGATFRFDGANDGTAAGSAFSQGLTTVGSANNGEFFTGDIAEIEVFTSVLTPVQIAAVEAGFNTAYAVPEPSALLSMVGLLGIAGFRRLRRKG